MMKLLPTILGASILLVACGDADRPETPRTGDGEAGKALAALHCSGCHTLDGRGKTPEVPNLAGQPEDYLVESLKAYREGTRHHVGIRQTLAEFPESGILDLAAFYAGLPPIAAEPDFAQPGKIYAEGEEIASACAGCHGESGISAKPGIPNLAGQHPAYVIVAAQEYARGERENTDKEEMLRGLGAIDIEKLAMYYAAQAPGKRAPPPFGDPLAGEADAAVCSGCHGARGISDDPMVPNLAGQEPVYLVRAIEAYRDDLRGHGDMVTGLSDIEIENIAAYYAIQTAGPASEAEGQTASIIAKCERCHGARPAGSALVVPSLRGQNRDYLLRVMLDYRDGERGNSIMHKMSAGYSDSVLAEIADYYAGQP